MQVKHFSQPSYSWCFLYAKLSMILMEGDEPTQMRLKTLDEDLKWFVQHVDENTVIVLMSDQGQYRSTFYEKTKAGKLEHKTPFLFIIVPERISEIL